MLTDHLTSAAATNANGRDHSRILPLAGIAFAAMLALTACSDDAEAPDDDGSSATEAAPAEGSQGASEKSPTADTTESSPHESGNSDASDSGGEYVPASADGPAQNVPEPEMPEDTTERSQDGVEAAAEFFWESYSYLTLTGDSRPFESISANDCGFCTNGVSYFGDVYAADGWYDQEPYEVTDFSLEMAVEDKATAWMTIYQAPNAMYRQNGEIAGSEPAIHDAMWTLELAHSGERWEITSATVTEGSGSEGESYEG